MELRAPFRLERLRAQRKESSHWQKGASYTRLFTQVHLALSFQLESLKSLPSLQHLDGALMDPIWNDHNKLLVKT